MADDMILDQGTEGACTGFALAAIINYLRWSAVNMAPIRANPTWVRDQLSDQGAKIAEAESTDKVSPYMLYHLARLYDEWDGEDYEGSSLRGALKGWHRHGVCQLAKWPLPLEKLAPAPASRPGRRKKKGRRRRKPHLSSDWPQDAAQCTLGAYYRIRTDAIADIQSAVVEVGAIICSASVHAGWDDIQSPTDIPVIQGGNPVDGCHAFAIVGYRPEGFIVQNSWGPDWGYRGFAILPYEDWIENAVDAWVCVLGTPVLVDTANSGRSDNAISEMSVQVRASRGPEAPTRTTSTRRSPWSTQRAYQHAIVLGNDGKPIQRLVDAVNASHGVRRVSFEKPLAEAREFDSICIFAHGGLNSEESAIKRAQVLGPFFESNRIYPIFLAWRTGFLESIGGILEDQWNRLFPHLRVADRSGGILDGLRDVTRSLNERVREAKDRTVEKVCQGLLVKPVWSQMKQNAEASAMSGHGLHVALQGLAELRRSGVSAPIHCVGHSAGAIILGHLLRASSRHGLKYASTTLLAPACTIRFALQTYKRAIELKTLGKSGLFIETLSNERERADSVGPYSKSLLYLVSRALERHKTPLLGLEASLVPNSQFPGLDYPGDARRRVRRWLEFAGRSVDVTIHDRSRASVPTSVQGHTTPLVHGSFDNDLEVMSRVIRRCTASGRLRQAVTDLRGF